jgi:HNH endonuclease
MAISRRLRYEVLRRDAYACRYCGRRAPEVPLTVDHVLPIALGGGDEPKNLVAACTECNAGKSSSNPDQPLVEQISDDAFRWARAMREAASLQRYDLDMLEAYRSAFLESWNDWVGVETEEPFPLPDDWSDSLNQFFRAGLGVPHIRENVNTAIRSQAKAHHKFRYFCGCCWRVIRERQEIALDLLARDEENPF